MAKFSPVSRTGKISVRLFAGFVLFFIIAQLIVMSGQRGGETFLDNLWISIPMLLAFTCAIGSGISGAISIIRAKDYAVSVIISGAIGLLILIFLLGEFLFPH